MPEVFAKVNSVQFLLVSKVANVISPLQNRNPGIKTDQTWFFIHVGNKYTSSTYAVYQIPIHRLPNRIHAGDFVLKALSEKNESGVTLATVETRKLGRVNFHKDFLDCCLGQGKKLANSRKITEQRVPSNDPRNNCGTHFFSSSLLISKVANEEAIAPFFTFPLFTVMFLCLYFDILAGTHMRTGVKITTSLK